MRSGIDWFVAAWNDGEYDDVGAMVLHRPVHKSSNSDGFIHSYILLQTDTMDSIYPIYNRTVDRLRQQVSCHDCMKKKKKKNTTTTRVRRRRPTTVVKRSHPTGCPLLQPLPNHTTTPRTTIQPRYPPLQLLLLPSVVRFIPVNGVGSFQPLQ